MSLRVRQLVYSGAKGVGVALVGALVVYALGSPLTPAVVAGVVVAVLDAVLTFVVPSPTQVDAERKRHRAESKIDKMERHLRSQSSRNRTGATLSRMGDDYW